MASVLVACALLVLAGCGSTVAGRPERATVSPPTTPTGSAPIPTPTGPAPTPTMPITWSAQTATMPATTATAPDSSLRPRPKVANVLVSGVAHDAGGTTYRRVLIGFGKVTCPACNLMTVTTDRHGAYSVSVPVDRYVVACSAEPYDCTVGDSGQGVLAVEIGTPATLDMAVDTGIGPAAVRTHPAATPSPTGPRPPPGSRQPAAPASR